MVLEILIGIFGIILTALGTILIMNFKDMKNDINVMSTNMVDMNLKLERVIVDQTWHKDEIMEIKARLNNLEKQ